MQRFCPFVMLIMAVMLGAEELPLRQAYHISGSGLHYSCADGEAIVFWTDNSNGDADINAQKTAPNGITLWQTPLPVIDNPGDQRLLDGARTSDGNYILLWSEYEIESHYQLRLQKINPMGQRLWQQDGVSVTPAMYELEDAILAPDASGGAYVAYTNRFIQGIVYGQHLGSNGQLLWGADTALFTYHSEVDLRSALADGEGGLIINVFRYLNNYPRAHVLRFSADGSPVGNVPLVSSTLFPGEQFDIMAGAPGQFILWHVYDAEKVVRFRKIDYQGNLLPTQWSAYPMGNFDYMYDFKLAATSDGGVAMAWIWTDLQYEYHIKVQKFGANMLPVWPEGELSLGAEAEYMYSVTLASSPSNYIWLAWDAVYTQGQGYSQECRAQLFDPEGDPHLDPFGKVLAYNNSTARIIAQADRAMFIWTGYENASLSLRRQVFDINAVQYLPEGGSQFIQWPMGYACLDGGVALQDRYFYIWYDSGMGKLVYQMVDANQTLLLEPEGRPLQTGSVVVDVEKLTDTSVAVLYYDVDDGYSCYYLQVIDSTGNCLYPGAGIDLSASQQDWLDYLVMSCYQGDIYLSWQAHTHDYSVQYLKGQRISDGTKMWGENGRILVTFSTPVSIQNFGFAGRYLVWRTEDYSQNQIPCKALMFDPNGDPIPGWTPGGMDIITNSTSYYNQSVSSIGLAGDCLVVFLDVYTVGEQSLRAQKIDPLGTRVWQGTGVELASPGHPLAVPTVVYSDDPTFLLVEGDPTGDRIILQRITATGDLAWPELGYTVASGLHNSGSHNLKRFADGKWLCAWTATDGQLIQSRDVFVRLAAQDGEPLGTQPSVFCGARYQQYDLVAPVIGNQAMLAWNDDRAGIMSSEVAYTGIWMNCLSSDWSPVADEITPEATSILGINYPNPFNPSTTIPFQLPSGGPINIAIYNLKGQLVKHLIKDNVLPAGNHQVTWNGRDEQGQSVASGIYMCGIKFAGKTYTRRMVLSN